MRLAFLAHCEIANSSFAAMVPKRPIERRDEDEVVMIEGAV